MVVMAFPEIEHKRGIDDEQVSFRHVEFEMLIMKLLRESVKRVSGVEL